MKKVLALTLICLLAFSGMALAETLTMATNVAFPPYEFYDDETGEATGIDVEIAKAVCAKMGYELEIADIDFSQVITGVSTGKYDFAMGAITVTEDRKAMVNFSDVYASGIQVVVVMNGSELTLDKLNEGGYTIGVQMGTTGDIYTTGDFEDTGLDTIERYNTGADAIVALTSGKIDCVIIDNGPAQNYLAANDQLAVLDTAYTSEDYAACFSKDNTELLDSFNATLAELTADGTVQGIVDQFITAD